MSPVPPSVPPSGLNRVPTPGPASTNHRDALPSQQYRAPVLASTADWAKRVLVPPDVRGYQSLPGRGRCRPERPGDARRSSRMYLGKHDLVAWSQQAQGAVSRRWRQARESDAMTDNAEAGVELSRLLAGLLEEIDSGALVASTATRYRIEGAVVALDVLGGADSASVLARLGVGPENEAVP